MISQSRLWFRKMLLLFAVLGGVCMAAAQSPSFRLYPLGEEYSRVKMEVVYQDHSGLIWVGTSKGLFSFDGLEYVRVPISDSLDEHVTSIYQNKAGQLLVGTKKGGLGVHTFHQVESFSGWPLSNISPIVDMREDAEGRFWVATYGMGIWMKEQDRWRHWTTENGLLGNDIYFLELTQDGEAWLGTDRGINIIREGHADWAVLSMTTEDGLPDDIIRAIIPDQEGNFWIGTYDKGITYFDRKANAFFTPFTDWKHGVVNKLALFEGLEVWIGTDGEGIWRYSLQDQQLEQLESEKIEKSSKVFDLHKDWEGNIWILSNKAGLCLANRQFETATTGLTNLQAVLCDQDQTIWFGTDEGLYSYSPHKNEGLVFRRHLNYEESLNVISLAEDQYGCIWVGTFGEGVLLYEKNTGATRWIREADGLGNNSILSIAEENGKVWLATLGGASELTNHANLLTSDQLAIKNFDQGDGLGTNFIYKVFVDSKQRTWFGTDGDGVAVLENGRLRNFPSLTKEDSILEQLNNVYCITEDHQGHLWFSTAKNGVFEYDGQQFRHLSVKDGIRDLSISSMATDKLGNILIVHSSGIDLLRPEDHHLIYYGDEVGISDFDPNLNAIDVDQYGAIWMGGQDRIVRYTPLQENLTIHPQTNLYRVSIFLEAVPFEEIHTFGHDQNNLVFEYQGLWYSDPEAVKYRYLLEGYDHGWIETRDRKITYSNLPPGDFTLKLSSTENEAWSDEPIVTYQFTIRPPIWYRWWFLLTAGLLIGGALYWAQRRRDQHLQEVSRLQKEKAESQLLALKAQINPHFLFNSFNTLALVIEENQDLAIEYVEKLSDFYRSILQYRDQEFIPIEEEIQIVRDYCYLLQKRFGDHFRVNIQLPDEPKLVIPLTLQLLVENAVKHNVISKNRPLQVDILMEEEGFITVRNNRQPKIHPEKSTYFGLQSLIKSYETLNGRRVLIKENPSTFTVLIPIVPA